jgi:hypothetical protein
MRTLAGKYEISDRRLAKACAAGNVPVPERGYWNKLQAGHKVSKTLLPPRGLGQSDEITIGRSAYGYYHDSESDVLNKAIPPPVFEEEIDTIRVRVTRMVYKAPLPKRCSRTHHLIAKLIEVDKARSQEKQSTWFSSSWTTPVFSTRFEMRRLNIINGLFVCLGFCGMHPSISGKEGRDIAVVIGDTHVSFCLDAAGAEKQIERERQGYGFQARDPKAKMRLSIASGRSHEASRTWQDSEDGLLEKHLREIAIELIIAGEQQYRDAVIRHREWQIQYKKDLDERERQRKIEEERKRREREARLEKQRVDYLLGQADAMHKAARIREFVARIQEANKIAPDPFSAEELTSWSQWARLQADRIDPAVNGSCKTRPTEEPE